MNLNQLFKGLAVVGPHVAVLVYHNPGALSCDNELQTIDMAILKPDTFEALSYEELDGDGAADRQSTWEYVRDYLQEQDFVHCFDARVEPGLYVYIFQLDSWTSYTPEGTAEGNTEEHEIAFFKLGQWTPTWWVQPAQETF